MSSDAHKGVDGLSIQQEPKYTTNGRAIINRASGEEIPAEEPVFIFRARDVHAATILRKYASIIEDNNHRNVVIDRWHEFVAFAKTYPGRMKQPDTTRINPFPPTEEVKIPVPSDVAERVARALWDEEKKYETHSNKMRWKNDVFMHADAGDKYRDLAKAAIAALPAQPSFRVPEDYVPIKDHEKIVNERDHYLNLWQEQPSAPAGALTEAEAVEALYKAMLNRAGTESEKIYEFVCFHGRQLAASAYQALAATAAMPSHEAALARIAELTRALEKIQYESSMFLMHEKGGVACGKINRMADDALDSLAQLEAKSTITANEIVKIIDYEFFSQNDGQIAGLAKSATNKIVALIASGHVGGSDDTGGK